MPEWLKDGVMEMPWLLFQSLFFIADELLADVISRGRREHHGWPNGLSAPGLV